MNHFMTKENKIIISLFLFVIIPECYSQKLFNGEPEVKVLIINSSEELKIAFNGEWNLTGSNLTEILTDRSGIVKLSIEEDKIKIQKEGENFTEIKDSLNLKCHADTGRVIIYDVPYGVGWWWEGKEDRIYEGEINIYKTADNKLNVIVKLPLEDYLKGVVPYEIGGDSPLESLKAQAVAARSEVVIALTSKLYSGEHHDLTSDVECQVFSGNKKRTRSSDKAVDETRGIILGENGEPINAYYASNCGGHSELIKNVWPDRPDPQTYQISANDSKEPILLDLTSEKNLREWIFSKPDVFCNPFLNTKLPLWSKKNFRWKREFSTDSISRMISEEKDSGNLVNIEILQRGSSGRINLARFIFEKDSFEVKGELSIRQLFHPPLRSSCFVIDKLDDLFILNGAGWGHGVGMCQSGAIAQANQGVNFEMILKHYYKEAELISIY